MQPEQQQFYAQYMDVDSHMGIATRGASEREQWEQYLSIQQDATQLLASTPSIDIYSRSLLPSVLQQSGGLETTPVFTIPKRDLRLYAGETLSPGMTQKGV